MAHHFVDNHKQPDGQHNEHVQDCGDFGYFLEASMEGRMSDWDTSGFVSNSAEPEGSSEPVSEC